VTVIDLRRLRKALRWGVGKQALERETARPPEEAVRRGAEPLADRESEAERQRPEEAGARPNRPGERGVPRSAGRTPQPAPERAPPLLA